MLIDSIWIGQREKTSSADGLLLAMPQLAGYALPARSLSTHQLDPSRWRNAGDNHNGCLDLSARFPTTVLRLIAAGDPGSLSRLQRCCALHVRLEVSYREDPTTLLELIASGDTDALAGTQSLKLHDLQRCCSLSLQVTALSLLGQAGYSTLQRCYGLSPEMTCPRGKSTRWTSFLQRYCSPFEHSRLAV